MVSKIPADRSFDVLAQVLLHARLTNEHLKRGNILVLLTQFGDY
jgi:hypothetical protein